MAVFVLKRLSSSGGNTGRSRVPSSSKSPPMPLHGLAHHSGITAKFVDIGVGVGVGKGVTWGVGDGVAVGVGDGVGV